MPRLGQGGGGFGGAGGSLSGGASSGPPTNRTGSTGAGGPLNETVPDTAFLSERLGLVNQYAPDILNDSEDAVLEMAQDTSIDTDDFMSSVLDAQGEAHISKNRKFLEGLPDHEQRAWHSQLHREEQRLLEEDGYVLPEPAKRPGGGPRVNLPGIGLPEWAIPGDAGGGELFDLPELGMPEHGGILGKVASAAVSPITGAIDAVSWAAEGAGELAAKTHRGYERFSRATFDMRDRGIGNALSEGPWQSKWRQSFRDSWRRVERGERTVVAGTESAALEKLGGDDNKLEMAFDFAEGNQPSDIAMDEGLEAGTPEFNKRTVELMRMRFDPKMDEAMALINNGKRSTGREFARGLGLRPGTKPFDTLSGVTDAALTLALDPLIVAGAATKAFQASRWGLKFTQIRTAMKAAEVDGALDAGQAAGHAALGARVDQVLSRGGPLGFGKNRFARAGELVIKALDPEDAYDAAKLQQQAPELINTYAEMRKWHQAERIAHRPGISDLEGYGNFWKSQIGASELVSSKAGGLRHQVRFLPGMSYKRSLAGYAKMGTERWIDWSQDALAKDFDNLGEGKTLLDAEQLWGRHATGTVSQAVPNKSPGFWARHGRQAVAAPGQALGSLVRQQSLDAGVLSLDGRQAVGQFRSFLNAGMWTNVPTWVRDRYFNEFVESGTLATRQRVVTRYIDEMMQRSGLAATPEGAEIVDDFVNKAKQMYGIGKDGKVFKAGLYPSQMAHMMQVPDAKSLLGISRSASFSRRVTGFINPPILEKAVGQIWKPSVVLRVGFIPRAVADELLGEMARFGAPAYVKSKVLTMNYFRHGTAEKLGDKGLEMFGNKGWMVKHLEKRMDLGWDDIQKLDKATDLDLYEAMIMRPFSFLAHNLNRMTRTFAPHLEASKAIELTEYLEDLAVNASLWTGNTLHDISKAVRMPTRKEIAVRLGGEELQYRADVYKRMLERHSPLQRAAVETAASRPAGRPENWAALGDDQLRGIWKKNPSGDRVFIPLREMGSDYTKTGRPTEGIRMFTPDGELVDKSYGQEFFQDVAGEVGQRADDPIGAAAAAPLQGVIDDDLVKALEVFEPTPFVHPDAEAEIARHKAAGRWVDEETIAAEEHGEGWAPFTNPDDPFDAIALEMEQNIEGSRALRERMGEGTVDEKAVHRAQKAQIKYDDLPEELRAGLNEWIDGGRTEESFEALKTAYPEHAETIEAYGTITPQAQRFLRNPSREFVYGEDAALRAAEDAAYRRIMAPDMAWRRGDIQYLQQTADGTPVEFITPQGHTPLYSPMVSQDLLPTVADVDPATFRMMLEEELAGGGYGDDMAARIADDFFPSELTGVRSEDIEIVRRNRTVKQAGGFTPLTNWTTTDPELVDAINRAIVKTLDLPAAGGLTVGRNLIPDEFIAQSAGKAGVDNGVRAFTREGETYKDTVAFSLDQSHLVHMEHMPQRREIVKIPDEAFDRLQHPGASPAVQESTTPQVETLEDRLNRLEREAGEDERIERLADEQRDQAWEDFTDIEREIHDSAPDDISELDAGWTEQQLRDMTPEERASWDRAADQHDAYMAQDPYGPFRPGEDVLHSPEVTREEWDRIVREHPELEGLEVESYFSGGATEGEAARDYARMVADDITTTFASRPRMNPETELTEGAFHVNHEYLGPAVEGNFDQTLLYEPPTKHLPFEAFGPTRIMPDEENFWQKIIKHGFDKMITPALNSLQRTPQYLTAAGDAMQQADVVADLFLRDPQALAKFQSIAKATGIEENILRTAWNQLDEAVKHPSADPTQVGNALRNSVDDVTRARIQYLDDPKLGRSLASYNHREGVVRVNRKAIQEDYDAGLAHLRGQGKATTSAQKKAVFDKQNIDIDKLKAWFDNNGGVKAYEQFISEHEVSHALFGHTGTPTSELMTEAAFGKEMAANTAAMRRMRIDPDAVAGAKKGGVRMGDTSRPPINLKGDDVASLRRHVANHEASEDFVVDLTAERTTMEMLNFIDDNRIRSQFQQYVGNLVPFHFAEEQFLKRWTKTLRMSPSAFRKGQLAMQGFRNMGIIQQDQFGNEVIVYPMTGFGMEVVQQFTGLLWQDASIPTATSLTGQVQYIAPGFDSYSEGRPGFSPGPFGALAVSGLSNLFPELRGLEDAALGERGSNRSLVEMLVPTQVMRFVRALDVERLQGDAMGWAQYLSSIDPDGSKGLGLRDGATAAEKERFQEKVINGSRVLNIFKAILGTAAPASPVTADPGTLQSAVDTKQWDPIFTDVLRSGLPIDEAVQSYIEYKHEQDPTVDVTPFTVFATKSVSGAPSATTNEHLEWMDANANFIESFPNAAPWLGPQPETGDEFDRRAYGEQVVRGLRERKTLEEYVLDMKFARAAPRYFRMQEQNQMDKALIERDSPEYKALTDEWEDWSRKYKSQHPYFAEALTSNSGKDRRRETLKQIDQVLNTPDMPVTVNRRGIQEMMSRYHRMQNQLFVLKDDSRSEAEALKRSIKWDFAIWARSMVERRYPDVRPFFESVIWPEMNVDGDLFDTPEVVEANLSRAS